jgi:hypothetical protein
MMLLQVTTTRSAILVALLLNLSGCLSSPERPDASVYGDPPHAYEQPARDAVSALPYFNSHSDTWHFVNIGTPYRAYQNGVPAFGNKLLWNGYVVEVVVSVKNHIGYSNQDTFCVQFDGDKVHGVVGNATRENLNKF